MLRLAAPTCFRDCTLHPSIYLILKKSIELKPSYEFGAFLRDGDLVEPLEEFFHPLKAILFCQWRLLEVRHDYFRDISLGESGRSWFMKLLVLSWTVKHGFPTNSNQGTMDYIPQNAEVSEILAQGGPGLEQQWVFVSRCSGQSVCCIVAGKNPLFRFSICSLVILVAHNFAHSKDL